MHNYKKISRFSIKSIRNAKHNETIYPDMVSKLDYYCSSETNFFIFSDDLTIIGVENNKYRGIFENSGRIIKKEKLNDRLQSIMIYDKNTNNVNTILVDENNNTFLAGDNNGDLVKYNLTNGKIIKYFKNIGISWIKSSTRLNNLCFFGGVNNNFIVMDNYTNTIILKPFESLINWINSIQICKVNMINSSKYMLIVTGTDSSYENN